MRSQTRLIVITTIFIFLALSFLHYQRDAIPNYIPQAAHDYFEPSVGQQPVGDKTDTTTPSPDPSNNPNPTSGDNEESNMFETERTSLDAVLEEFVNRPLMPYQEAVELNSKSCPTGGVNFDAGSVQENKEIWAAISSEKISNWRHDIASYLRRRQELVKESKADGSFVEKRGRGIVMAAGDAAAVMRARTNLRLLKSYNCSLPVEIFHFPTEVLMASELEMLEVEGMNVTVKTVEGVEKGNGWKAFEIKGAAMQQSSFDDILYLDTDSYLLRNPEGIFEGKYWMETGLLLWPDYTKSHPTNPIWRLLGMRCRNEYEGESGQIFISRSRHQDVLWLVEYFAQHHYEFYGFMGGDRDSFRAAALLLGKKWAGPGRLNAAAGIKMEDDKWSGGHTMLQADPEGKWMFVHANLIKHAHFQRPLWSQIHRVKNDRFVEGSTYGDIGVPNDGIGEGVKLRVSSTPRMVTTMSPFEGYADEVVTVDEWDVYDELRGFEDKWFAAGGVH